MPIPSPVFPRAIVGAVLLACAAAAPAAEFTVGAGAACSFNTVQAAIDAALAHPDPASTIRVARNRSYTLTQTLVIAPSRDIELTIAGGFADCTTTTPTDPPTLLDGNDTVRVMRMNLTATGLTATVTLRDLELANGRSGADGGALFLRIDDRATTSAVVRLQGVVVRHSSAVNGGGIALHGNPGQNFSSGRPTLEITGSARGPSVIRNNRTSGATDATPTGNGGGLSCTGIADVVIDETRIASNVAAFGGGLYARGTDSGGSCRIQSSAGGERDGIALGVRNNTARLDGGGAYMARESTLTLQPVDPAERIAIIGNRARRNGGGIVTSGPWAWVVGVGVRLADNIAGTAMEGHGGGAYLSGNSSVSLRGMRIAPNHNLDRACTGGVCNEVRDNRAGDGHPGSGGAFFAIDDSSVSAAFAVIAGNRATTNGSAIAARRGANYSPSVTISGSLVHDHDGVPSTLSMERSLLQIWTSTIAGDSSTHSTVRVVDGGTFSINETILHSAGVIPVTHASDVTVTTRCVLSNSTFASGVQVGDPQFVDAAAGNYRLAAGSPAIDRCWSALAALRDDLDGNPRGLDDPDVPDGAGPHDIGAYEYQPPGVVPPRPELVFRNGFEG